MRSWSMGVAAVAVAVVVAGCSGPVGYDASIYRTAVFSAEHVRPLAPLTYPVAAATLTGNPSWAEGKAGQPVALPKDTWISVEPEVRTACAAWPRDQVLVKLHQLLGLKPVNERSAAERFVRFTVADGQATGPTGKGVFRPCANPDPAAASCGNTLSGDPAYVTWFANNMLFSYAVDPDMARTGYPWTRLGYTWNWDPTAPTPVGAQEYVVPAGTMVTVVDVVTPESYCAPSGG